MLANLAWTAWICFALALAWPPVREYGHLFMTRTPARFAGFVPFVPVGIAALCLLLHLVRKRIPGWADGALLLAPAMIVLLWREPAPLFLGLALALSAHGIGAFACHPAPQGILSRMGLRFAFGFAVLIWLMVMLGLAGWLRPISVGLLLLPAFYAKPLIVDLRDLGKRWSEAVERKSGLVSICLSFAIVFGALGALWAITPTIAFDPLKMHLMSARWYAETGVFQPLPNQPESFYPQGAELLMTILWLLGGQQGAQMLGPAIVIPTFLILAALLHRLGLRPAAALAGLVAAFSLPFLHWTAFVAKNDFPLALFLLASLLCLLEKRPILASFFLAMAFQIKHVALFGAVGLTPLFLIAIWRSQRRWRTLFAVGAVFLVFGTFSLVRTWWLIGDPLYPESLKRTTDISVITHPHRSTFERVMRYAGIPWLIHFDGQRAFQSSSHNPMGIWLVLFAPGLLVLPWRRSHDYQRVGLFCGVYVLYWVSILVTLRYAIAPLMILAALPAVAAVRLPRWLSVPATFLSLSFSLIVIVLIEVSAPQIEWLLGERNRESYLSAALPSYDVIRHFQGSVHGEGKIFSIGNCAGAYAPRVDRFSCAYRIDLKDSDDVIEEQVHKVGYRYLILEQVPENADIPKRFPTAKQLYSDAHFAAYDLNPN